MLPPPQISFWLRPWLQLMTISVQHVKFYFSVQVEFYSPTESEQLAFLSMF